MTGVASAGADRVIRASWLTPQVLVALVRTQPVSLSTRQRRVLGERAGQAVELGARWLTCSPPADPEPLWLLTMRTLPQPGEDPADGAIAGGLTLRDDDDRTRPLAPASLEPVLGTLSDLVQACREELSEAALAAIPGFLAGAPAAHRVALDPALAAELAAIRDEYRVPLPATVIAPGPLAVRLEDVTALGHDGFWLTGWIHDDAPSQVKLVAISPEGVRAEPAPGAVTFHPRPAYSRGLRDNDEVSTLGFHALIEPEASSLHPQGWVLEFHTAGGEAVQDAARKPVLTDAEPVLEHVLEQVRADPQDESVLENQVLPALSRLRGGAHEAQVEQVLDLGEVPAEPQVSVVVAVRRNDRIQHQLVEFARDPELAEAELIFVASPVGREDLAELGQELHDLYGVSFRLVVLSRPARRPRALNLGAGIASGELLVLMSGDVLPSKPGWLGTVRAFAGDSASIGALGPKLLREDDSIAHAGAEYVRRAPGSPWERQLPLAGLAHSFPGAESPRRVQALSDACLILPASRFREGEGFSELYLGGGDEAGDLCLRLAEAAGEIWYLPEIEMYLLDRPDRPARPSPAGERFNSWLFAHRWRAHLDQSAPAEPAVPRATRRRARPAPAVPGSGSGRAGEPIEELEVISAEADREFVLDGALLAPRPDDERSPYAHTYTFAIDGWAIARDGRPLTIELRAGTSTLRSTVADLPRPAVAARYPATAGAQRSGFQFIFSSLTLPAEFDLAVDAVDGQRARVAIGRVRGRRRPLRTGYKPALQPLLVNTLGRSGSSWLVTLLSRHPEIVALHPLGYEARLTGYWMDVLQTLARPESYMQELQPELADGHWWIGDERQSPLPRRVSHREIPQWLGNESMEILAGFCQSRFDGFYDQVAQLEDLPGPRLFAEKCVPGGTPQLIGELYPDGREIVLVRDFRDMACSILDYNAKRGFELWGRAETETDAEWFQYLRRDAASLLADWRRRCERSHLVRYEDLIIEPETALSSIFAYLGVDAESETVRRTLAEALATMPEAQANHRTSASIEASMGRWKQDLSPEHREACAAAFDDILVEFGYEPTVP